jgi:uncharacterized beta-barrel protein YwiB (DUF1934 family)
MGATIIMKVRIEFESRDAENEVTRNLVNAVMEVHPHQYRLVFVEDLSGDGKKTKSTMLVSPDSLRIIRTGELNTDFIYGPEVVHHTSYQTPYGSLPVTLKTTSHSFSSNCYGKPELPEDFEINSAVKYMITMGNEAPLPMEMKIRITGE